MVVCIKVRKMVNFFLILKVELMGFVLGLEVSYELSREIKFLDLNIWKNRIVIYRDGEGSRRSRFGVK